MKEHPDAAKPSAGDEPPNAKDVLARHGAYLPHWTRSGAIYAVTFRLSDSLPRHVLETLRTADGPTQQADGETTARHKAYSEQIEEYLDSGHGSCGLREARAAGIVADSLRNFDGRRYVLHAWCVMPNHVHVVVEPIGRFLLPGILHSWKSYSAKEINQLTRSHGQLWQAEYYDHLIRDEADYLHALEYVAGNPIKAGFRNWPWVWIKGGNIGS